MTKLIFSSPTEISLKGLSDGSLDKSSFMASLIPSIYNHAFPLISCHDIKKLNQTSGIKWFHESQRHFLLQCFQDVNLILNFLESVQHINLQIVDASIVLPTNNQKMECLH